MWYTAYRLQVLKHNFQALSQTFKFNVSNKTLADLRYALLLPHVTFSLQLHNSWPKKKKPKAVIWNWKGYKFNTRYEHSHLHDTCKVDE